MPLPTNHIAEDGTPDALQMPPNKNFLKFF